MKKIVCTLFYEFYEREQDVKAKTELGRKEKSREKKTAKSCRIEVIVFKARLAYCEPWLHRLENKV